jgi:hypothetical protein
MRTCAQLSMWRRFMNPKDEDYYIAAISDAVAENLTIVAVDAAYTVAANAEQFFWAVQASVWLKNLTEKDKGQPDEET